MTRTIMPPTRPGPLQDLPIEYFRSQTPSSHPATRPLKRPLSPGAPGSFGHSPTKRRLLNDEGIIRDEKVSGSATASMHVVNASPSRLSEVVQGQDSSVKKQDINTSFLDNLPSASKPSTDTSPDYTIDHFPLPQRHPASSSSAPIDTCHYPGFQVYIDPHPPTPECSDDTTLIPDSHLEKEVDESKENRPPPRKLSPATQAHLGLLPLPKTIDGKLVQEKQSYVLPSLKDSTVETGNDVQMEDVNETPRHNRIFFSRNVRIATPSAVTRKALRQLMEDEVDVGEDDDSETD